MMDQATIARYQSGGDIYQQLAGLYGYDNANYIATAARTGDATQVNAALVTAKYGANLDTSTFDAFYNQITTDPLAAPLAGLNNVIKNSVASFVFNPWVLAAGVAGVLIFSEVARDFVKGLFKK